MHLETLRQLIFARYSLIPTSATIAAAVLIIASFNGIIGITVLVKLLIVVLLIIIPVALCDFTFKLNRDLNRVMKEFEEEQKLLDKKSRFQKILDGSNYIYVAIISIVIIVIVCIIYLLRYN